MLRPSILFPAITIVFSISVIYCDPTPTQEIDLQSILEIALQQNAIKDKESKEDRSETDSREEDKTNFGSLKTKEIVELLQKAIQGKELQNNKYDDDDSDDSKIVSSSKYRSKANTGRNYYELYKQLNENEPSDDLLYAYKSNAKNRDLIYKHDDERDEHNRYNQEALEQLLSQNVLDKKYESKPKYRLVPNNLVGSLELTNEKLEDRNNLGAAYSKVYVILNPKAIEKSANKDKLNNLLTKILSLKSSSYGLVKGNKESRYKGFYALPELLSRRARRESRENSIEEDVRPKRIRGDRGGGGGGGSGRTAIPYIRHRGDIYERE